MTTKESSMTAAARVVATFGMGRYTLASDYNQLLADYDALARERDELRNLHRLACNLAVERYEQLEQAKQRVEALEFAIRTARYELLGVGQESSREFHRIGVENTLGILTRALCASSAKANPQVTP